MSIKMFKIVSGEFIVGETTVDDKMIYIIKSPMVVHFSPHPSGQLAINLFPLNPFTSSKNDDLPLNNQHIIFDCGPVQDSIEKEYLRITSGIITTTAMPSLKIK